MDSRPGPVGHCRSCVSYVYVFSKKKLHEGMQCIVPESGRPGS